jgi:hypothetical protein
MTKVIALTFSLITDPTTRHKNKNKNENDNHEKCRLAGFKVVHYSQG